MARPARSTLSEVTRKLSEVSFEILKLFDKDRWINSEQLIYSTVSAWETSYEAYLVQRKIENVKFPFAALTRNNTQETQKLWNKTLTAYNNNVDTNTEVNSVKIKPVRVEYILAIYDQRLEDIEAIADLVIVQGQETQRLDYFSEVLQQQDRISFIMQEPVHEMIPDKAEKRKGKGFIYGLYIPIIVDCVLGIKAEEKLITTAVLNTVTRIPEPLPEDIQTLPDVESETIDNEDC